MTKKNTTKKPVKPTGRHTDTVYDRLTTEDIRRDSASMLGKLFEHSLVGIYVIAGGKFSYVNPRFAEIFGYTDEEILTGVTVNDLTAPEFRPLVEENIRKRLDGIEQSIQYTYDGIKKNGERITVEVFGSRTSIHGSPAIIGMLIDVTGQKTAEEILRRQTLAMRASMDGMAILTQDGLFTFVNDAHARIYGYDSPEELMGKSWEILYTSRERRRLDATIFPAIRDRGEWHGEAVGRRKDGSTFDQEISINLIEQFGLVCVVRDISPRKRVEAELLKLRQAVDSAAEAIFMTDRNGVFTYVNPGFQALYGFNASEVIGKTTPRILKSGRHQTSEYEDFWQTLRATGGFRREMINRTRDGRLVEIEMSVIAVIDERNDVTGYLAIQNDITARKQSDRELRSLNRSLRTISECNEILVHANDEQQLLNDICRVIVQRGGYNLAWVGYRGKHESGTIRPVARAGDDLRIIPIPDALSGTDDDAVPDSTGKSKGNGHDPVPEESPLQSFQHWQNELFRHGYNSVLGLPLKAGDRGLGTLVICSLEVNSFNSREIQLLMELANDLAFGIATLRARKEHAMAEVKINEQAALLDVATDAILVRDLKGKILFWNRGAERLYGWPAAEALGKDVTALITHQGEESINEALRCVMQAGEWSGEHNHVAKDGTPLVVESRWALLRDEGGRPKSCLIVNTDITAKKKLEAQFLRAQRMEGLGTLAGGIAHDLNNVLTPIMMSVDILRGKFPDPETRQVLNLVETTVKRGASMVQQVLTFARGMEDSHVLIQPKHLLLEIDKIVRETFPKTIRVKTNIEKNLGTVLGDVTQLHQVFLNLCINARDAMPDGGLLSVSAGNIVLDRDAENLHPWAKPGSYVVISVNDTGAGIPPEIIHKIFEPFFTTKEHGKGTGLGLSTTESIVKSHGGFITVDSQPGHGASFRVYLPSKGQPGVIEQKKEFPNLLDGNGEMILIVDDEVSIREITREMLETYHYRTLVASDGVEAVSLYTKHRDEISVVITDMLMPGMDGSATIRALKSLDPSARIIAVSGYTQGDRPVGTVPPGAETFLQKPFTTEQLLSAIAETLLIR